MHIRLPKLHGFKRPWRIDYQVVNVGRISEYAAAGRFGSEPGKLAADRQQRAAARRRPHLAPSASRSRCSATAT